MNAPLTRRKFLQTTATAVAGAAAAALPQTASFAAAPEAPVIIDTHTHFYDPSRPQGVPWPPKNDALLYRTVLPKDYKALPKPQPVTATVVVEASVWLEDNQWILDLAAEDKFIAGFVGNLAAGKPEFAGNLKRFTANKLFRGIRLGSGALKDGWNNSQFLSDLKLLAEHDLALDALGTTDMLPVIVKIAQSVPNLRIIIDHVANISIDGKAVNPEWKQGMEAVGKHRHVFCKVSGLVEGTGKTDGSAPRDAEFYRPVLDTIWEAFGEDKLVYGSNWPVSERFASCATVQSIVQDYFSARGKEPLEKVFSKNSHAFYKWLKR